MKIILLFVCFAISGMVVETTGARQKRAGGGKIIPIELAPYYVSLRRNWHHVCGGAFISKRHVLTAAHCVLDKSLRRLDDIFVVSGTDEYHQTDVGQPIIKISPHEDFLKGNLAFDIAVATARDYSLYQGRRINLNLTAYTFHQFSLNTFQLSADVEWNIKHNRIALPIADPPYREFVKLTTIQSSKNKYSNPGLRELEVRMDPIGRKSVGYGHVIYGLVKRPQTLSMRDAGGPLVHKRRIVGIVSWMIPTNHYACNIIDVFKFKTFIENSIANETSPNLEHSSGLPWAAKRRRF